MTTEGRRQSSSEGEEQSLEPSTGQSTEPSMVEPLPLRQKLVVSGRRERTRVSSWRGLPRRAPGCVDAGTPVEVLFTSGACTDAALRSRSGAARRRVALGFVLCVYIFRASWDITSSSPCGLVGASPTSTRIPPEGIHKARDAIAPE